VVAGNARVMRGGVLGLYAVGVSWIEIPMEGLACF
jgi:hypothetical protein